MSSQQESSDRVLYVVTCATPAARDIGKLVSHAQASGWTVCVIATPLALRFIDRPALEAQTGYPVRSEYKQPGTPDVLPPADAMVVGGASFNTINKWAAGISDTLALGLLNTGIKRFHPHEIKVIVGCCCKRCPDLDQKVQADRLEKLWEAAQGRGPGQLGDAAPLVSPTPPDAVNDLAEGVKNLTGLLGSKDEEIARLRAENDRIRGRSGVRPDASVPTAPANEAGSPPSTNEYLVVDGEVIDRIAEDLLKPDELRASRFRLRYEFHGYEKPPGVSLGDPRRLYLGLFLLSSLMVLLYRAQNLGWWAWTLTGVVLAVLLPAELHRHRLGYLSSSLPAAVVPRWRWPGRPQITWYLSPTDTYPADSETRGVHTTFTTVATRRPRMLPGYLPRDGSVWAERLTGRLRLSNCMPRTVARWSIVDINNGRYLAQGELTVRRYRRSRTVRLSKCKFHSHPGLRKVGIHLIATGPAKVSWSAAGVSEWRGILFNSIEWWYDTFTYLAHAVINKTRRRHRRRQEKRVYATLHRHRPDLPPMLQAQTTRLALGSNDRDPVPTVFRYGVTDVTHDKQE